MSNTYTWSANTLIGYPQYEGRTDVVITVNYTVTADDGNGHTASIQSSQSTPLDPSSPFIPFPNLNNDIVIGWVQNAIGSEGVDLIENSLDAQIELQTNPPVSPVILSAPWLTTSLPKPPPAPEYASPNL